MWVCEKKKNSLTSGYSPTSSWGPLVGVAPGHGRVRGGEEEEKPGAEGPLVGQWMLGLANREDAQRSWSTVLHVTGAGTPKLE